MRSYVVLCLSSDRAVAPPEGSWFHSAAKFVTVPFAKILLRGSSRCWELILAPFFVAGLICATPKRLCKSWLLDAWPKIVKPLALFAERHRKDQLEAHFPNTSERFISARKFK